MKTLDCESLESTYKSIEAIFGVNKEQLNKIFDELAVPADADASKHLFSTLKKQVGETNYDATCWFHLSNVPADINFTEGLLPTDERIETIWQILKTLASDDVSTNEFDLFREQVNRGGNENEQTKFSNGVFQYRWKVSRKYLCGPYAMLVKEIAFHSNIVGNHDYLNIPEIVEDICLAFEGKYGFDLKQKYIDSSRKCIVKFKTAARFKSDLEPALMYLYYKHKNYDLNLDCNTCFDGHGITVPAENILSVEWL